MLLEAMLGRSLLPALLPALLVIVGRWLLPPLLQAILLQPLLL
jgi:hypothetical protein